MVLQLFCSTLRPHSRKAKIMQQFILALRTGMTMDVNHSSHKYKITVHINHSIYQCKITVYKNNSYQCIISVNINHSYKYKIAVKYYILNFYINFIGCSII